MHRYYTYVIMEPKEKLEIKKSVEKGTFNGLPCRVVFCGSEIELVCITDITKYFGRRIDQFIRTLKGKDIYTRLVTYRGKSGFSLASKADAHYVYQWCQHPLPQNCVERFEDTFITGLEKLLNYTPYENLTLIKQFEIGGYRIDAFIPELNICIEYDEKHHSLQIEKDKKREQEIEKLFNNNVKFIRINKGHEVEGYGHFLKTLYTL
jgi:very-short-patch-repair endonuclease